MDSHIAEVLARMQHEFAILLTIIIGLGLLTLGGVVFGVWAIIRQMQTGFREMHAENMNNQAIAQAIAAQTRELLRRTES
jgi:hypothetical protein